MSPLLRGAAGVLLAPSLALALTLVLLPGLAGLALRVYLLVVLALASARFVRALPGRGHRISPFEEGSPGAARRPQRLPELERLEREVELGGASAYDLHYRLRPTLRELAGGLLAARRGIDLDREPDRARAVLGEEVWELVRAGREPPDDRRAPGLPPEGLARVVSTLERV
jgi:hypothetical protein